ncbi:hypothetical protein BD779DRAFT_1510631, partial [Infundibulicybe gibba]
LVVISSASKPVGASRSSEGTAAATLHDSSAPQYKVVQIAGKAESRNRDIYKLKSSPPFSS